MMLLETQSLLWRTALGGTFSIFPQAKYKNLTFEENYFRWKGPTRKNYTEHDEIGHSFYALKFLKREAKKAGVPFLW